METTFTCTFVSMKSRKSKNSHGNVVMNTTRSVSLRYMKMIVMQGITHGLCMFVLIICL